MTFETEHEHGHGHGHKTGVPWLDIIVAVSAVFISVVSLVVSIAHGRTMERSGWWIRTRRSWRPTPCRS